MFDRVSNGVVALAMVVVVAGCATKYQPMGFTGGYTDQSLGDNVYLIQVNVNAYTSAATAYRYFHRRAQELCQSKGFSGYRVLDEGGATRRTLVTTGQNVTYHEKPQHFGRVECLAEAAGVRPSAPERSSRSGSAFMVSGLGHAVTNAHVVESCGQVHIHLPSGPEPAQIIAADRANDLALLQVAREWERYADLALSVRQGDNVAVYGYPLTGVLASTGNYTTGIVTALVGPGDDSRLIQLSAPVQPGSSGSPVLDSAGDVVGVVLGKLDAIRIAQATHDIPQNVNFAVKATILAAFLDAQNIGFEVRQPTERTEAGPLADVARRFTFRVECTIP